MRILREGFPFVCFLTSQEGTDCCDRNVPPSPPQQRPKTLTGLLKYLSVDLLVQKRKDRSEILANLIEDGYI